MFAGLGIIDEALDVSFPLDRLAQLIAARQAWVACPEDDVPVGMVIASVRDNALYIEEMDVLPAHGRRGLGSRLLAHACSWGEKQGLAAVVLSTFRDVPWNGPFYRRFGFRNLPVSQWAPYMHAIRQSEAQHGLQTAARTFMRLMLQQRPDARS